MSEHEGIRAGTRRARTKLLAMNIVLLFVVFYVLLTTTEAPVVLYQAF